MKAPHLLCSFLSVFTHSAFPTPHFHSRYKLHQQRQRNHVQNLVHGNTHKEYIGLAKETHPTPGQPRGVDQPVGKIDKDPNTEKSA